MTDHRTLSMLASSAYRAGNYREALERFRRVRRMAEARGDQTERICTLYWEGDCLDVIGESDAALATLLEGATTDPTVADPAEIFNCWITAVDIATRTKDSSFSRTHLDEIRNFVDRHGLGRVLHRVYFSEGYFEYARGNYAEARDFLLRSVETHRRQHPYLTRGSHLYLLCLCWFRLRDEQGLARAVEMFEATDCELAQEKLKLLLARLLLCRARGLTGRERAIANDTAQTLLVRIDGLQRNLDGFYVPLIRVLHLLGNDMEVERRINRLARDGFDAKLLKADLFLSRARSALGYAAVDDDWSDAVPEPEPVAATDPEALAYLRAAATLYNEAAAALVEKSPETAAHVERCRHTIAARLSRLHALGRAASGEH